MPCGQSLSSLNSLIRRSTQYGLYRKSLHFYDMMLKGRCRPDNLTFLSLIKSCAQSGFTNKGKNIHAHLILMGFESHLFVQTALLDMYGKIGDLASARDVFDGMCNRSTVSFNAMIDGYCKAGDFNSALEVFKSLLMDDKRPNQSTLVSITGGCNYCEQPQIGLSIHCYGVKLGVDSDSVLCNSIMNMYISFGHVESACFLFNLIAEKSVVSWTTIIGGCQRTGDVHQAFSLYSQMRLDGVRPDSITFVNMLSASDQVGDAALGSSLHASIIKVGCDNDDSTMTSLLSMYMNLHDKYSSHKLFSMTSTKSVFLWTALISGYVRIGDPCQALNLFQSMLCSATKPNAVTITSALSACAELGSLVMGKYIEEYIYANDIDINVSVATALINMYCKCGSVENAKILFDRFPSRDLPLWSTMIMGYAIHGKKEEAIDLFYEMIKEGVQPDAVVFAGILTACRHSGSVKDGLHFFSSLKDFDIEPESVHYSCMVDLLSRAGYLNEAWNVIQVSPVTHRGHLVAPLLSACRTNTNLGLAEYAHRILQHEPSSCGNYILLSNIYAESGKWNLSADTRKFAEERGMFKEAGFSMIELDSNDLIPSRI